jgi:flavin-dependent dehydrogenase
MENQFSETKTSPQFVDVFIIGGGPAGSTAGSWLGRQNGKALICEKERFPRFHIGESLLPNSNRILQEIGVWEKIQQAGFIEKYGAEFTLPDHSLSVRNAFTSGLVKGLEQTYQVERSQFDKILLDHAASSGCEVRQRTIVSKTTRTKNGWAIVTKNLDTDIEQTVEARWIIDASGRNCMMGRTLGIRKETIPYPGRFSIYNHFEGFVRAEGKEGGNIIILRLEDACWFWAIPISESVTSIGIVARKGSRTESKESREEFFWRKIKESSFLSDSLSNATSLGEYRIESDYSFSYETYGKEQTLLAGDAASFIDPVFSSGVYLALESGLLAAKTVNQQLNRKNGKVGLKPYILYTKSIKSRIRVIRHLIDTFYDNQSFEVFMYPKPSFKLPRAINSILAGCLDPPFRVKWRFWIFRQICALHKKYPFIPPIRWNSLSEKSKGTRDDT